MICPVCGRNIQDENAHFCENCGASLRNIDSQNLYGQPAQTAQPVYNNSASVSKKNQPVSFKNWLGTMLLPYIPFVGSLVYFVMLIIWACSGEVNETKRNWARASLVVNVIATVLMIVVVVVMMGLVMSDPAFSSELYSQLY